MTDDRLDQRLFLRTVELGAIRKAALDAGIEASSVSRRLTALESRLGTRLLDRSPAMSRPTEAGLRYYERLRSLLAQLDALEDEIAGENAEPRGLLRVNASIDFGQRHVAGWLLDFRDRYPGVEVELTLSARHVDLTTTGIDVALRVGELPSSALISRRLALVPRVLVAAPALVERLGAPQRPADLDRYPHVFFLPEHRHGPLVLTGPDGARHDIPRHGGVTVNAVSSVVEAVRRGHGCHLGPLWAFADAIDAGEVVVLLPGYAGTALPLTALRTPAVVLPARIRLFIDFLAQAVRAVRGLTPV